MAFDKLRFEKFAMYVESQTDSDRRPGWCDLDAIGDALHLSREEAREYASYMREEGWANTEYANGAWIRVTLAGRRAIANLRRAPWEKWVDRHPILVNVFWMFATALVA